MSFGALRYRDPQKLVNIAEFKREGSPNKPTKHHVPPRNPDKTPRIIKIDERHHRAYHLLFGVAKSYEDACYILKRDWWSSLPDLP